MNVRVAGWPAMAIRSSNLSSDDVDLRNLMAAIWRDKGVVLLVVCVCTAAALSFALLAPEIFRAEALVQPRQENRPMAGGLGALAAQFGAGDLVGLTIAGGGDRAVAIATLKSRTLIEPFLKEKNVLPKLYKSKWDAPSGSWKAQDPSKQPTLWQAYNDFTKNALKISEDRKTGLVTVAIEWQDPDEAKEWVTELIARANEYLRARAIQSAEKNLAYLEAQSRAIGQVELQRAVYGLVEVELKKLMLARGGDEFAFVTVDAATSPKKRLRPVRRQIALIGFLLGWALGIMFVLFKSALSRGQARLP